MVPDAPLNGQEASNPADAIPATTAPTTSVAGAPSPFDVAGSLPFADLPSVAMAPDREDQALPPVIPNSTVMSEPATPPDQVFDTPRTIADLEEGLPVGP